MSQKTAVAVIVFLLVLLLLAIYLGLAGKRNGKGGESFLRMNIACPRSLLLDGLSRLQQGVLEIIG